MPDQQMRFRSQGVKNPSQLDRDISSSNHRNPFWLFFDIKEPIRIDSIGSPGDVVVRGDRRSTSDGDDDFLGVDSVGLTGGLFDLNFVGRDERCPTLVFVDFVVEQIFLAIVNRNTPMRSTQPGFLPLLLISIPFLSPSVLPQMS